jgi:DNA-binding ferritin-like protein
MEEIIGILFYARTIAHKEHLKTKSFAQHMALNTFYEEVIDLADKLAEAYQGCEGIMKDIPLFGKDAPGSIDDFLEKQMDMIEKLRKSASSRSAIQNIIDEVIGLYLSTLYKLRNLS